MSCFIIGEGKLSNINEDVWFACEEAFVLRVWIEMEVEDAYAIMKWFFKESVDEK